MSLYKPVQPLRAFTSLYELLQAFMSIYEPLWAFTSLYEPLQAFTGFYEIVLCSHWLVVFVNQKLNPLEPTKCVLR